MQWEYLNSKKFCEAVKDTNLCILPMGVLERHSDHMPLGTDCLAAHYVACKAAEKEDAVVFPTFYFGQSNESRAFPGNISLNPILTLQLLEQVLDEIARNGFQKILLYSWHGGNIHMNHFLAQTRLWEKKPYSLYVYEMNQQLIDDITSITGCPPCHADIWETSVIMALHPESIHMEQLPKEPAFALGRLSELKNAYTGIWWYADYPENYTNDAHEASSEKGRRILDVHVKSLAECIRHVKEDVIVKKLEDEYQKRAEHPVGKGV